MTRLMVRLLVMLGLGWCRLSIHLLVSSISGCGRPSSVRLLLLLLLLELHHLCDLTRVHVCCCWSESSEHGLLGERLLLLVHHRRVAVESGPTARVVGLRVAGRAAVLLLGEVVGRAGRGLRRQRPEWVRGERRGLHAAGKSEKGEREGGRPWSRLMAESSCQTSRNTPSQPSHQRGNQSMPGGAAAASRGGWVGQGH